VSDPLADREGKLLRRIAELEAELAALRESPSSLFGATACLLWQSRAEQLAAELADEKRLQEDVDEAVRKYTEQMKRAEQAEKKLADHLAYWGDLSGLVRRAEQAEAELEALRCCGNCGHYQWPAYGQPLLCGANEPGLDDLEVEPHDNCRWTPARWAERGAK
jgi:hypothetical protein